MQYTSLFIQRLHSQERVFTAEFKTSRFLIHSSDMHVTSET